MPTEGKPSSSAIEPEHVVTSGGDIVIQTIPSKFYGAALRANIVAEKKKEPEPGGTQSPPAAPAGRRGSKAIIIGISAVLLLGVAGGFVYFNQQLLFGPPQPGVAPTSTASDLPKPSMPPPPPSAPSNLSATATATNLVQLAWTDASNNEAGFRIERREATSPFASITSLPPNSTAYQDHGVQASASYVYRVIALNEGGDSPPSNEASAETPAPPPSPPEVPKLPPVGLDTDSDGLTDLEEPIYGAAVRDPDTDHDTFLDGNEVFHLYNPASGKNAKLIESNLVKVFESPVGWKMFVPVSWKTELNADGTRGKISTGHGETFIISFEDNSAKRGLVDWYLERHPGVLSSQIRLLTTKTGFDGLEGVDPMTTYFPWGNKILVFTYDLDGQPFVNFRTTYEMMRNSVVLSALPNLPTSAVPESSTTTDSSASSSIPSSPEVSVPSSSEPLIPVPTPIPAPVSVSSDLWV